MPAAYEYHHGVQAETFFSVDPVTGRSDVLHLRCLNPLDTHRGLSSLTLDDGRLISIKAWLTAQPEMILGKALDRLVRRRDAELAGMGD